MGFIIYTILVLIILILSLYIFLLKKEIKRIVKEIRNTKTEKSNVVINKEINEKNINKLIKEINSLIKEINQREINVYTKSERLQKMITNIAHDLRTPLTSAIRIYRFNKKYRNIRRKRKIHKHNRRKTK